MGGSGAHIPDEARFFTAEGWPAIVGRSRAILEVRQRILLAAGTTLPVLVTGETGVGKELVARAIHTHSPRRGKPFVAHNAGTGGTLAESILLGYARGAPDGRWSRSRGGSV